MKYAICPRCKETNTACTCRRSERGSDSSAAVPEPIREFEDPTVRTCDPIPQYPGKTRVGECNLALFVAQIGPHIRIEEIKRVSVEFLPEFEVLFFSPRVRPLTEHERQLARSTNFRKGIPVYDTLSTKHRDGTITYEWVER